MSSSAQPSVFGYRPATSVQHAPRTSRARGRFEDLIPNLKRRSCEGKSLEVVLLDEDLERITTVRPLPTRR